MRLTTVLVSSLVGTLGVANAQQVVTGDANHFATSADCIACHSGLSTRDGHDVSIGYNWRASMMANSARDPYWQAAVRREIMDHPVARAAIEDKCSTCHMPMARFEARTNGEPGTVFERLSDDVSPLAPLASDGVSCTVCHQIQAENFGSEESFTGGFVIAPDTAEGTRAVYGPHDVDGGRQTVMRSAAGFSPEPSLHLRESELCATCHTLYTHSLDESGREVAEVAEQVPYLEWQFSAFRATRSCQDCHMPELDEEVPISSVLGEPRPNFSQHVFRGGNAFMLGILNRHRSELGVVALPQELDATRRRTEQFLRTETARVDIEAVRSFAGGVEFEVAITNLAGHKLPTAYPSRRVWLHVTVLDDSGDTVFESGRPGPDGSIAGNDNDREGDSYEPHHRLIESAEQVQIYESVLVDAQGRATTGLLTGVAYGKDNRLLPEGFDKIAAPHDIAVIGEALADPDFSAPRDVIRYRVATERRAAHVEVELLYQSIGFRWAENLKDYDALETQRFAAYYEESAHTSVIDLARRAVAVP